MISLASCKPETDIFNKSTYSFTNRQSFLLSFGLHFFFLTYKPNFIRHYRQLEKIAQPLIDYAIYNNSFSNICDKIKEVARESLDITKKQILPLIFIKSYDSLLEEHASNNFKIITGSDKERGVVILIRADFIRKMQTVLLDRTKLQPM